MDGEKSDIPEKHLEQVKAMAANLKEPQRTLFKASAIKKLAVEMYTTWLRIYKDEVPDSESLANLTTLMDTTGISQLSWEEAIQELEKKYEGITGPDPETQAKILDEALFETGGSSPLKQ